MYHEQPALRLVITGAPACGKGTQCARFIDKYDVVHISTGDLLRKAVSDATELGVTAKSHMDKGELVHQMSCCAIQQSRRRFNNSSGLFSCVGSGRVDYPAGQEPA